MAITWNQREYKPSESVVQAQQALQGQQAMKPQNYESKYQADMSGLLDQYRNRGPFNYDVNADALYQQAQQRAIQQGQQAMMDTMGQASALTGGYGNSYAMQAGQQAYGGVLQGLYDSLPQYYQMAKANYDSQGDELLRQYQLLGDLDETAYGRFQDDMSRYYADLDRAQKAYDTERDYDYGMWSDAQKFDYNAYRDSVADDQFAQQMAYQRERDAVADAQWQAKMDEDRRRYDQQWADAHPVAVPAAVSGVTSTTPVTDQKQLTEVAKKGLISGAAAKVVADALVKSGASPSAAQTAVKEAIKKM